MTKRAKILTPEQFTKVLGYVADRSSQPLRDVVIFTLSYKAGLRAQEISGLNWEDMTDVEGKVRSDSFTVSAAIAKKGHMRQVPMHAEVRDALVALQQASPCTGPRDALVAGIRVARMSPNYIAVYIKKLYTDMGFQGCSSHSGRRTFTTTLARTANQHGCSLRDVQKIVGHRFLDTTEKYIEVSGNVAKLVAAA